jgi:hypothetical protein
MQDTLSLVYPDSHMAITDGLDFRNAALWFDYVVPLNPHAYRQKFVTGFMSDSSLHVFDVASALSPPDLLADDASGFEHLRNYIEKHLYAYNIWMIEGSGDPEIQQYFDEAHKHLNAIAPSILKWEPARIIDALETDSANRELKKQQQIGLALMGLNLIDVSNVTWQHILEFREDTSSRKNLRALRLMFYEDYSGKPQAFVRDHIEHLLDRYDRTAKKWNFDLVKTTLVGLVESKTLLATASGTIAAAMFGGPLAALTVGAAIELGHVSLKVLDVLRGKREFEANHPLAYLFSAREKFGVE